MWGYQQLFNAVFKLHAERVLSLIGIDEEPQALLVGIRWSELDEPLDVQIYPEIAPITREVFDGIESRMAGIQSLHPLKKTFYGEEMDTNEKAEDIKLLSLREAVTEIIVQFDAPARLRTFCGWPVLVRRFHVVPVLRIASESITKHFELTKPELAERFTFYPNLIHAAAHEILEDATAELQKPDPGRNLRQGMRSEEDVARRAATSLMHSVGMALNDPDMYQDLFETFNIISSLQYERSESSGHCLLINPQNESLQYKVRFHPPIPLRESTWARKTLQMANSENPLVVDFEQIHGMGGLNDAHDSDRQDAFHIEFLGRHAWEIKCGDSILMRTRNRVPTLPQEQVKPGLLVDTYKRLFPDADRESALHFLDLFNAIVHLTHGCTIVVAMDAKEEYRRLAQQATIITPTLMTPELLEQVSRIDGAILMDPSCQCHAIGVILDGQATDNCTPSRGSRYNSTIRYVESSSNPRLALVWSDDNKIDFIPRLRPRVRRELIEMMISKMEAATMDDYLMPRNWLDSHRFYLDAVQCKRVNDAFDRFESSPVEGRVIRVLTTRFKPDAEMNESYLI